MLTQCTFLLLAQCTFLLLAHSTFPSFIPLREGNCILILWKMIGEILFLSITLIHSFRSFRGPFLPLAKRINPSFNPFILHLFHSIYDLFLPNVYCTTLLFELSKHSCPTRELSMNIGPIRELSKNRCPIRELTRNYCPIRELSKK